MSASIYLLVFAVSFVLGLAGGVVVSGSRSKDWLLVVGIGAMVSISLIGIGWELFYLKAM